MKLVQNILLSSDTKTSQIPAPISVGLHLKCILQRFEDYITQFRIEMKMVRDSQTFHLSKITKISLLQHSLAMPYFMTYQNNLWEESLLSNLFLVGTF